MPTDLPPSLPPSVVAFDGAAAGFDERFGALLSVAAQRLAVRRYLLRAFAPGASLLELGAGTGDDALFLLERGYRVLLTDGSPAMVAQAASKVERAGYAARAEVRQVLLEHIDTLARTQRERGAPLFDGAYSNFAALNCVADLSRVASPLAAMLRPGAACVLVVFGPLSFGEVVVELLRGRPRASLRRLQRGPVAARLGGRTFTVWYPSPWAVARALAPWFQLRRMRGIGVLVPPSVAEPTISRFPRLVNLLAAADRVLSAPLAAFGDHVLLHFERTSQPAPV